MRRAQQERFPLETFPGQWTPGLAPLFAAVDQNRTALFSNKESATRVPRHPARAHAQALMLCTPPSFLELMIATLAAAKRLRSGIYMVSRYGCVPGD